MDCLAKDGLFKTIPDAKACAYGVLFSMGFIQTMSRNALAAKVSLHCCLDIRYASKKKDKAGQGRCFRTCAQE
jgi:hypothetical protein